MSISSKRSTVRPVELSLTMAPEEMLAVEELSIMQEADVLDKEARDKASKQSAEDEALQVAQVDMPTEYLENPAAAAEVMSDVGEAGLIGEESISRWEAQEVAFAGAGGGSGAGFWGGFGGFGAAAGGIAVGGKLHQNSMDSDDGSATDTTQVVFDLRSGESSTHSGRSFDSTVSYDVYVIVDQNDQGAFMGVDWGLADIMWSGGENLGSDDTINLVLATGRMDLTGKAMTMKSSGISPSSIHVTSAWFTSLPNGFSTSWHSVQLSITSGSIVAYLNFATAHFNSLTMLSPTSGNVSVSVGLISGTGSGSSWGWSSSNAAILNSIPAGLLTTQGLA